MRRSLFLLCLSAAILTSCGAKPQEVTDETRTTYSSEQNDTATITGTSERETEKTTLQTAEITSVTTEQTTTVETEATVQTQDDTYKKLYRDYLSERLKNTDGEEQFSAMCFDIFDIDSDGAPELFFAQDSSHSAGVMIFTVTDGEMINISRTPENGEKYEYFGSNGQVEYYPEKGYILSSYSGSYTNNNELFRLEDHELKKIMTSEYTVESEQVDDEWELRSKYTVDDEEVTEEDFHDTYQYFEGISVSLGQSFLLSEEMLNAVFTDGLGKDKAYDLILKREESFYSGCYYCMYDIDKNGTDDLILRSGNIYTYDKGLKYIGRFNGYREYQSCDYYRYTDIENETEYSWSEGTADVSVSGDGTVIRVTEGNNVLHSIIQDGIIGYIERYSEYDLTNGGKLYTVDYIPVDKSVYDEKIATLNGDDYVDLEFKEFHSS